jgi:hypothetical protein
VTINEDSSSKYNPASIEHSFIENNLILPSKNSNINNSSIEEKELLLKKIEADALKLSISIQQKKQQSLNHNKSKNENHASSIDDFTKDYMDRSDQEEIEEDQANENITMTALNRSPDVN